MNSIVARRLAADLIESQTAQIASMQATMVELGVKVLEIGSDLAAKDRELVASQAMLAAMRAALIAAAATMDTCQITSHREDVCFDGDHWHEIREMVRAALSPRAHTEDKT